MPSKSTCNTYYRAVQGHKLTIVHSNFLAVILTLKKDNHTKVITQGRTSAFPRGAFITDDY